MTEQKPKLNLDPDFLAQLLLDSNYVFDDGSEKLGDVLREAAWTITYWRGDYYLWSEEHWRRMSDDEMRRIITESLQRHNDSRIANEKLIPITKRLIGDVLLCLSGRTGLPELRELNSWPDGREKLLYTVPFKNGLLCFDRRGKDKPALIPHTPKYFTVNRLPYGYDPEAKCPNWECFVSDVMLERQEYIDLLQEWAGYLFRPDLREQKFLLCVGDGANGKGVFTEVIEALVGKENCSEISLSRFNSPFALYPMLGRVLNATNESSHIIEDEAENVLKFLVAGDRCTFERKFKELVFAVPTAKIQICTNALPRFGDKSTGLWRRVLLVPFNKVIPEGQQIKNLADELKRESSGIFNWSLEGWRRLNNNYGFTKPSGSEQLIEEYRRDADPCRAFLQETYSVSSNGEYISCTDVYGAYKKFCTENSCTPMNERNFGRNLRRVFPAVNRARVGSRSDRTYVYKGLVSYEP